GRGKDDPGRAKLDDLLRAFGRPNAAADPAREFSADRRNQRLVCAGVHCRVEVDELNFGIAGEPFDPAIEVAGLDGELLALHELDDTAALKVDGRNEEQSRVGTPRDWRYCFSSETACSE